MGVTPNNVSGVDIYGALGIKEVQIIQWFVQPGARVEQFDKLCEVASDKAIVEVRYIQKIIN